LGSLQKAGSPMNQRLKAKVLSRIRSLKEFMKIKSLTRIRSLTSLGSSFN